MNDDEIEQWVAARRQAGDDGCDAFTATVMAEIRAAAARPERPPPLPSPPQALTAGFCLAAGAGKILLALHLAL